MGELSRSTDFMHTQNILLQKNQERLTKHKLLSEATNFYERFKINTKWFLIRGNRPFSTGEISTLFSWLIISQLVWVILGTTTFVSLVPVSYTHLDVYKRQAYRRGLACFADREHAA